MDQDRVERPAQAKRPHVADEVLGSRDERTADLEHRRRQVGQRERDRVGQVRHQVAAARAELEQRLERAGDVVAEEVEAVRGLVGVLLGRRQQREPRGEVAVQVAVRDPLHPGWAPSAVPGSWPAGGSPGSGPTATGIPDRLQSLYDPG